MKNFKIRSSSAQLADFLRDEICSGCLGSVMPGETWLTSNLRVGRNIVREAMKKLEKEGLLIPQGRGRPRLIRRNLDGLPASFRVTLLLYSHSGLHKEDAQRLLRRLGEAGYQVEVASKTLVDLKMDVGRVARMVGEVETDAWIIFAGPRDILEWFAGQATPCFALYGRFPARPMAGTGPGRIPAYQNAIRRLVELGHRRIVFLLPDAMRKPTPSRLLEQILAELDELGIPTGDYTCPEWKQTPEGLRQCLENLFRVTPPSALFIEQPREFHAVQQYLTQRGIIAPRDISLVCTENDPDFEWSFPLISHFDWSLRTTINRVARWVSHVSRGEQDLRSGFTPAKFVEGGTIGPVAKF